MTTIVVAGALANKPFNGGEAWVRLSWLLGLRRLGFQVRFIEQISRETCIDQSGAITSFDDCVNRAYFDQVTRQFDISDIATLIYADGEQTLGLSHVELLDLAGETELLVNISGHLTLEPLISHFHRKAYIDIDPGFTQFWYAAGIFGQTLLSHDFCFTIGENIGQPICSIPTGDIRWRTIRQPVVLEQWPFSSGEQPGRFTTIASWRGPFGPVTHNGKTYGLKVHEWRKFVELPERAPGTFEVALNIHPADEKDLLTLKQYGWQIVDPSTVASDPGAFRRYVQGAGAEFSVAQGIYVDTHSGWFSDRTVRYLASGKPVLVQETGFSRNYSANEGLVAFSTIEEAVAGAQTIVRDYEQHCRGARAIAEEYFDSDKVLGKLIEEVGI